MSTSAQTLKPVPVPGLIQRTNPALEDCVICEALGEPGKVASHFDASGYARCNQHKER